MRSARALQGGGERGEIRIGVSSGDEDGPAVSVDDGKAPLSLYAKPWFRGAAAVPAAPRTMLVTAEWAALADERGGRVSFFAVDRGCRPASAAFADERRSGVALFADDGGGEDGLLTADLSADAAAFFSKK